MLGRLPGWRYRGGFYLRTPIDWPWTAQPTTERQDCGRLRTIAIRRRRRRRGNDGLVRRWKMNLLEAASTGGGDG